MNDFCKYEKTIKEPEINGYNFNNYYVVNGSHDEKGLFLHFKTNFSNFIRSSCMVVRHSTGDFYKSRGFKEVKFDSDVEMLFDIQLLNEHFYKLSESNVFVACNDINDMPKILIKVNELYIIYTPKIKDFNVRHRVRIESSMQKDFAYINKYTSVVDAFKDPILKNYIDILNDI